MVSLISKWKYVCGVPEVYMYGGGSILEWVLDYVE